jgi:ABC-type maltose transport system permease subunit
MHEMQLSGVMVATKKNTINCKWEQFVATHVLSCIPIIVKLYTPNAKLYTPSAKLHTPFVKLYTPNAT